MKEFKKYKVLAIFQATRCDVKLSKDKEKRLRQIIKEINKLDKEMNDLFEVKT